MEKERLNKKRVGAAAPGATEDAAGGALGARAHGISGRELSIFGISGLEFYRIFDFRWVLHGFPWKNHILPNRSRIQPIFFPYKTYTLEIEKEHFFENHNQPVKKM